MSQRSPKEIEEQYHQFVADHQFAKALRLATEYFDLFPAHAQRVVYFWRMQMACKLKDKQLALATLRESIEKGHWYANLQNDADFQILVNQVEFHELVNICTERRAKEIANARSIIKILPPKIPGDTYPLLFALHGNSSNVDMFASHWRYAQEYGWMVALPQSPQAQGPGKYSWNDWEWVIPTIVEHNTDIRKKYPIDRERIVLAGFSMGAGLALWLALEQTIRVQGLICVAPFLPDVNALQSVLAQEQNRKLRIYLVASREDEYCYKVALKLSEILPAHGIPYKLDVYQDTGHAFPTSFEKRVPLALDFILNRS